MRFAISIAGMLLLAPVHDHGPGSWINQNRMTDPKSGEWCCSQEDCRPEVVTEVRNGYLVETGEIIPFSRVIWQSPDGRFWRCHKFVNGVEGTRCLIAPKPSS